MTASKNPVASGGSTTLTVTATNATQVVITEEPGSKTYTLPGTGGQQVVSPTGNTTYQATATGSNGSTNVATVAVTIIPTATLVPTSTTALPNQLVILNFSSANATSSTINGVDVPTNQAGSLKEYMTQTTTYTFTVSGPGGKATASTTVTVVPPVSFNGLTLDLANLGPEDQQDVDPNGAVGTKQFMEYVNIQYQAYDKTTYAPVWSSPQIIGTAWGTGNLLGADSTCDTTTLANGLSGIHLDAVIDFDRLANRWVIMGKADSSNAYNLCLAVSNTDDLSSPTLGWYGYDVSLPSSLLKTTVVAGQTLTNFPDWPRLGIWQDGYYVAMDVETPPTDGGAEIGVAVCVFDRNDILTQGSSSPQLVAPPSCVPVPVTPDSSSGTYLGHSLIPADIDGTTAPPSGRPEYMVSIENPSIASNQTTSSVINLWEAQVDWSASVPLTVTSLPTVSVATYTPGCYLYQIGAPAYTECVLEPQNDSQSEIIDSVGDRLMPRFPYRNFGSYESYLVTQTVQTGPGSSSNGANAYQTGIRWYELRVNSSGTPYINQSNTINPDSVLFRFLPSIAQDHSGNAAVGYSFSNGNTNPGINFSFWNLGTANASPTEVTLLNGPGEELTDISTSGIPGEWGTYSSMTVDPVDDCTFWYVNEYYPTDSLNAWSTQISNFKVPGCQ